MKKAPQNLALLTLFLFSVFSIPSIGQHPIPIINQQQQHAITSKITGVNYQLSVSLPMHYTESDSQTYAVLYLLDGNYTFPTAHATRTGIDIFGGLDNIIIVGIGYTWEQSLQPWFANRWADFTPTSSTSIDTASTVLSSFGLNKGDLKSGGADAFIEVLKKEIIPLIDKNYKTNADRGISGHSLGGLFAGYCLVKEPTLFQRYGILSPSFWWDGGGVLAMEEKYSTQNQALHVKVFMSVGSLENPNMVSTMRAFSDTLKSRNYTGFQLTTQVFEEEDHMSVIPASISRMLKVLYPSEKK